MYVIILIILINNINTIAFNYYHFTLYTNV